METACFSSKLEINHATGAINAMSQTVQKKYLGIIIVPMLPC